MANIIAVIWDCDKTLVDGYMQDPIFDYYNINASDFWDTVNELPSKYKKQGVNVNPDTIYLNHFIHCAKDGTFPDLSNEKLRGFGRNLKFYNGIPDFLKETSEMLKGDSSYGEFGIQVEHYIVSTGFAEIIKGSELMQYVKHIWGCELIEDENEKGKKIISEIGYTIDNTTKTRAIFEINKGIHFLNEVDVNSNIPEERRRVHMKNMIYIADGPSDIPAFSVVHSGQGATFAIYPRGDAKALHQVEQMRIDGRVDMYAEADYTKGTTAYLWIKNKIQEIADRIKKEELEKIMDSVSGSTPKHLTGSEK